VAEITDKADTRVPRAVSILWTRVEGWGWAVSCTWARGETTGAYGPAGRVVSSVALDCRRGAERVWLVWHDGRTVGGWAKTNGLPRRKINLTIAKTVLASVLMTDHRQ